MSKKLPLVLLVLALGLGGLIGWVDSRPNWDDTGITVGLVFLAAAFFGALRPSFAWLLGLAVGLGVPLWGILGRGNYGGLIALVVALIGAGVGAVLRKVLGPAVKKEAGQ